MFELRLCLALGKSRREVRSMPYPDFRLFQMMYLVEPWGFPDREQRTASILAQIYNSKVEKRSQLKKVTYWIRDMGREVLRYIRREIVKEQQPVFDIETPEGKKQAAESVIRNFEMMFGKRVVRKDKK